MRKYFEIYVNDRHYETVYDDQEIIKISCDLVNAYGVNPDDIKIIEK